MHGFLFNPVYIHYYICKLMFSASCERVGEAARCSQSGNIDWESAGLSRASTLRCALPTNHPPTRRPAAAPARAPWPNVTAPDNVIQHTAPPPSLQPKCARRTPHPEAQTLAKFSPACAVQTIASFSAPSFVFAFLRRCYNLTREWAKVCGEGVIVRGRLCRRKHFIYRICVSPAIRDFV